MSKFSAGLRISNVDDFLVPSQECIKPVKIDKSQKTSRIIIGDNGDLFGETEAGNKYKLEKAKIVLEDCLACSGCITTAEEILIQEQSSEEFLKKIELLRKDDNNVIIVTLSPQSKASLSAKFNLGTPEETHNKLVNFLKSLGVHSVIDSTFGREFSLMEISREFREIKDNRKSNTETSVLKSKYPSVSLPLFTGACPGWVCFAEKHKKNKSLVPMISRSKSPQQIMGYLVKRYLTDRFPEYSNNKVYHAAVMPCFDKKLESSRQEFAVENTETGEKDRDVDIVISTVEIADIILNMQYQFSDAISLPHPIELIFSTKSLKGTGVYSHFGSSSGGYLDYVLRDTARKEFNILLENDLNLDVHILIKRTNKNYKEIHFYSNPEYKHSKDKMSNYCFVYAYGLKNIQKVLDNIFRRKMKYDFVEVMACPGGCVNGGGQLKEIDTTLCNGSLNDSDQINNITNQKLVMEHVECKYQECECQDPMTNLVAQKIYDELASGECLHTTYNIVEPIDFIFPTLTTW